MLDRLVEPKTGKTSGKTSGKSSNAEKVCVMDLAFVASGTSIVCFLGLFPGLGGV